MRKPDLTAPRFRYKCPSSLDAGFIKRFRLKFPQYAHYKNTELTKLVKLINKRSYEAIVFNRDGLEIPSGLGNILIGSVKLPKGHNGTNYGKSAQLGVRVYNRSFATDGHLGMVTYTNTTNRRLRYKQLWKFTPVREFKRLIAKEYPKNWQMYIKKDEMRGIWELFKKQEYRHDAQNLTKENLKEYSEFE